MADGRNFRSSYLVKVGIKGVEEKKSVEILLKDQLLDQTKLNQFCLRFPVPLIHRAFLWKVLLGILPVHQGSHDFVLAQRREQYENLEEALAVMKKTNPSTPRCQYHRKMMLLEEGMLPFDESKMLNDPASKVFFAINDAMAEIEKDPVLIYWLTTRFYSLTRTRYKDSIPLMTSRVEYYLSKEDTDGKLYGQLTKLNVFGHLPTVHWFHCGFAGVLPEGSYERVWDKIIGGSAKILVYVAVAILLTFRRPLLCMKNVEEILKYLAEIPTDSGDIIVSKAIEIWEKHGSLLMPATKSDSPSLLERLPS